MGLDIVELVMEIEEAFGVEIRNEAAENLETVGSLYDYVAQRVAPHNALPTGGPYDGELWERFLDIFEKAGVERAMLRPDARLVDDLELN